MSGAKRRPQAAGERAFAAIRVTPRKVREKSARLLGFLMGFLIGF